MQVSEPLSFPGLADRRQGRTFSSRRQQVAFPFGLLVFTWMALFPLHNSMSAPLTWFDEQSASDLAQIAQQGNMMARAIIILLGAVGTSLLVRYRWRLSWARAIAVPALTYYCWNLLSGLWADQPALTSRRLISFALMLLFAGGCALRMRPRQLSLFIAALPTVNLVPGLVAELRAGTLHPFSSEYRFVGTSVHPNVQAATLSFAVLLWFWLTCQETGRARLLAGSATGFVGVFLLLTGSRTAILAVIIAIVFSLLLMALRFRRHWLLPAVAVLIIVFGAAMLAKMGGRDLLGGGASSALHSHGDEGGPTTFNGRVELWQSLLGFVRTRPLQGYGYGSFWSPERIEAVSEDQGWAIQQSHSAYLDQILALGIPGGLLYISVLFLSLGACARRYINGHDSYGAWAAVLVFVCVHNFTEAINVSPEFTNFAINLIVLNLAFVSPMPQDRRAALNSSVRQWTRKGPQPIRSRGVASYSFDERNMGETTSS